jgi:hypothetical protein
VVCGLALETIPTCLGELQRFVQRTDVALSLPKDRLLPQDGLNIACACLGFIIICIRVSMRTHAYAFL